MHRNHQTFPERKPAINIETDEAPFTTQKKESNDTYKDVQRQSESALSHELRRTFTIQRPRHY
jgi:hypothetical protein